MYQISYILDEEAVVLGIAEGSIHALHSEVHAAFISETHQQLDLFSGRQVYNTNSNVNNSTQCYLGTLGLQDMHKKSTLGYRKWFLLCTI